MRRAMLSYSLIAGLLVHFFYQFISCFIKIDDIIAIPMFVVSTVLMLVGVAYSGWCLGKHKNPFSRK